MFYFLNMYTFFFPLITASMGLSLSAAKASSSALAAAFDSSAIFAYFFTVR